MLRKLSIVTVLLLLVTLTGSQLPPAAAQGGANAWASYQVNMRVGPGPDHAVVTTLAPNTGLVLEGRNEDTSWVLGHTEDNAYRGWVSTPYLRYQEGFAAFNLPLSGEIVGAAPAPAADQPAAAPQADAPAAAPAGGVNATTTYSLNVRSAPSQAGAVLRQLPGGTNVVLEARDASSSWVLGHTEDGTLRGWMASLYIRFTGVSLSALPVSSENVSAGGGSDSSSAQVSAPIPGGNNVSYQDVRMGGYDPARIQGIDLTKYPVVPSHATGRARAIFLDGKAKGNNPHVMAKVGDCSSEHWYFLSLFGWGRYNLGSYTNLQEVVNWFGESLGTDSQATHNGFNVNAVMAPEWSNPAYCQAGESPLECEYRLNKPAVSVIMFGTSDLLVMTPYEFDFYMRDIVDQTIEAGVIPVLSTFPGNLGFWNKTLIYNQVVVRIALDYDIPLINLWLALEGLPNHGLEPDGFHLGEGDAGSLTAAGLQSGYGTRNLITLQTLDVLMREAMR